ncbi:hypothetical protein AB0H87_34840, partial [Asanoa sp. NPDC050611]
MTAPPAYDAFADWYEEYTGSASSYMDRVRTHLARLLGSGAGPCLDLCCGGGAHAATIRALGWTPVGRAVAQWVSGGAQRVQHGDVRTG